MAAYLLDDRVGRRQIYVMYHDVKASKSDMNNEVTTVILKTFQLEKILNMNDKIVNTFSEDELRKYEILKNTYFI